MPYLHCQEAVTITICDSSYNKGTEGNNVILSLSDSDKTGRDSQNLPRCGADFHRCMLRSRHMPLWKAASVILDQQTWAWSTRETQLNSSNFSPPSFLMFSLHGINTTYDRKTVMYTRSSLTLFFFLLVILMIFNSDIPFNQYNSINQWYCHWNMYYFIIGSLFCYKLQ